MEVDSNDNDNDNDNDASMMQVDDDDDDNDTSNTWHLIRSFTADDQGVRAACVLEKNDDDNDNDNNDILVTGTQMGSLFFFNLQTGHLLTDISSFQHDHAVTALVRLSNTTFASGCKDSIIRIFSLVQSSLKLAAELKGHEKPVTSFSVCHTTTTTYLVSGSWDGTAKVWNATNHSLVATLSGHENAVCVSSFWNSTNSVLHIATGSAGVAQQGTIVQHAVRTWSVNPITGDTALLHRIAQDHDGPVRGLAMTSNTSSSSPIRLLASCSNDGTVKLRNATTGKPHTTLSFVTQNQQHAPMLLSCATVDHDAWLVAGAEDGHVVAWKLETNDNDTDNDNNTDSIPSPQVLLHPSCVWQVFALSNGDFGTCCQDGKVYIFSRSTATSENHALLQHEFDAAVAAASAKSNQGPSPDEVAKLPDWEREQYSLQGRSEGQVQLFQENGTAIAAQWSATARSWIKVGQVMGSGGSDDGSGSGGTNILNGVQYNHVFPIQVDQPGGDGVANLQIGYNDGENPFVAAQRFIDEHVLPQYHLSQIADYIQQRIGNTNLTLGGGATGTLNNGQHQSSSGVTSGTPLAIYVHVPAKSYKTFDLKVGAAATTFEKMKAKLQEGSSSSGSTSFLSESQLNAVDALMQAILANNQSVKESHVQVLLEMLDALPLAECFPALDLARLAVLQAETNSPSTVWKTLLQKALELCQQQQQAAAANLQGPAAVAIPMLSLRLAANMFASSAPACRDSVVAIGGLLLSDLLSCAKTHVSSSNKNVRLSVATLLYNICLYLHSNKDNTSSSSNATTAAAVDNSSVVVLVDLMQEILTSRLYRNSNDGEAVFRTIVALGTLLLAKPLAAKGAASAHYMAAKVEPAASPYSTEVKAAAKEVYTLLA